MRLNFYENILKFRKTYDDGWVKIYKTTNSSSVGLVDIIKTGYEKDAEKQMMLSFQVSNIKGWYSYIKNEEVKILKPLSEDKNSPIKAFLIEDPGGYKVEFFKWNK